MWFVHLKCWVKHLLICKRRGHCQRQVLHRQYSYCHDCGRTYDNGELIGGDGATNSQRVQYCVIADSQSAYERFSDACRTFAKALVKGLAPWLKNK